jgi:phosphatidylethanolamine/phosphatidyl-N-methylethanolamine N-methyltransferase
MSMPTPAAARPPHKWKGRRAFLAQFIEKPFMIGAVAPSSSHLAAEMVRGVDFQSARAILEFGAGSGVFTDAIVPRLNPNTKFIAIELNTRMVEAFRTRLPEVTLVNDSAEHARRICDEHGIDKVDCIISGLPWASFSSGLQDRILASALDVLRPGGTLITFGYHVGTWLKAGRRFYAKLPGQFAKVEKSTTVWRNFPPGFVVRCTKK